MLALECAQIGEQRGDLAGVVFVDAMQTYERNEHDQARREGAHGLAVPFLIGR